jgi:hypothetical protein
MRADRWRGSAGSDLLEKLRRSATLEIAVELPGEARDDNH